MQIYIFSLIPGYLLKHAANKNFLVIGKK